MGRSPENRHFVAPCRFWAKARYGASSSPRYGRAPTLPSRSLNPTRSTRTRATPLWQMPLPPEQRSYLRAGFNCRMISVPPLFPSWTRFKWIRRNLWSAGLGRWSPSCDLRMNLCFTLFFFSFLAVVEVLVFSEWVRCRQSHHTGIEAFAIPHLLTAHPIPPPDHLVSLVWHQLDPLFFPRCQHS